MFVLSVFLLVLVILYLRLRIRRARAGVESWIEGHDLDGRGKTYLNNLVGIKSRPDIVTRDMVVEVKSTTAGRNPYMGDVLQVAGEMAATGKDMAELRYANRSFLIRNSPEIKGYLYRVLGAMKYHLRYRIPPEGTPTPGKCRVCEFRMVCPEAAK